MNLTPDEKKTLLMLAREAIDLYLREGTSVSLPIATGSMAEVAGAFVTLHKKSGELRGCIGNMIGRGPLVETIREMATAAAVDDPRFPPLGLKELEQVDIEISVLSPMHRISNVSEIEVGRDGLMITKGMYRGVLLPQVATEYGWDRETFLTHLCSKAGLDGEAWKDSDVIIEKFTAEVFGEKELDVTKKCRSI